MAAAVPSSPTPVLLHLRHVERKFNPNQLRDPRSGEWTRTPGGAVSAAADKLKLAGRIELADGEDLLASDKVNLFDGHVLLALIRTPSGPRLRLGLVGLEDDRRWRAANLGGTVDFDRAGITRVRDKLADLTGTGQRAAAEMTARVRALGDDEPIDFDRDVTVAEGAVRGGPWGDLGYAVELDDDTPTAWNLTLAVRPPDASGDWSVFDTEMRLRAEPAEVKRLLKRLDAMATLAREQQRRTT